MRTQLRTLCLWGLMLAMLATATLPAQRPRKEEEDDKPTAPAPKKQKKEEEEERPGKAKVLDVDDDSKQQPAPRTGAVDLAKAAREVRHPSVKALFTSLAVPSDRMSVQLVLGTGQGGVKPTPSRMRVQPLPLYAPNPKELKGTIVIRQIDSDGNTVGEELKLDASRITELTYHERFAVDSVREFVDEPLWKLAPSNVRYLKRLDQLVAAEQALSAVARWHQSAGERGIRPGAAWSELETLLRSTLADVLVMELGILAESRAWDESFAVTNRISELAPRPSDPGYKNIIQGLTNVLSLALRDPNFARERIRDIRDRLRRLEEQFPGAGVPIALALKEQAGLLLARSRELVKAGKRSEALDLLREAEETWPDYPGLRPYRASIDKGFKILRVGMAELPTYLSPGWAFTDSERRCLDLLFEPLVSLVPDYEGRLYYQPSLALQMPIIRPLGRQFHLPVDAHWSDGRPLGAGDLRATVRWMQEGKTAHRLAAWGDQLDRVQVGGNAHRVDLTMRHGFIDPLALMSFKVLPAHVKADDKGFALNPIGSGPFVHAGKDRSAFVFRENPHYGTRSGHAGLPRSREIRLFAPADPVKSLTDGEIDMAFDLTSEQAGKLQNEGFEVPLPGKSSVNRRIYFLAVNHRRSALAVPEIRLALALGIDREALLDEHFRPGMKQTLHKSLSGPYPVGSWACEESLVGRRGTQDPFDLPLARAKFKQGLMKLGVDAITLSLKVPTGNRATEEAMKNLCVRLSRDLPGLTLMAEGVNPHQLRDDVEGSSNFELAYYHYDYPAGSFWLWPLLGAGEKSTENYLGYSGPLLAKVQKTTALSYFPEVRKVAREVHVQMLKSEMPFVPLWQLDPLYAFRKGSIEFPPFDPREPFARAAEWR
ncbi:MAG: ABC transporter substrate-binding protein [Planctomycetia bacterium]|nr:ABC transporter substrate-binding protein [Planctomycetia bacterium]